MQGARLEEMRMHTILKPECTTVHEARFIIWQDFAATKQMGEFSPKHYLIGKTADTYFYIICNKVLIKDY